MGRPGDGLVGKTGDCEGVVLGVGAGLDLLDLFLVMTVGGGGGGGGGFGMDEGGGVESGALARSSGNGD